VDKFTVWGLVIAAFMGIFIGFKGALRGRRKYKLKKAKEAFAKVAKQAKAQRGAVEAAEKAAQAAQEAEKALKEAQNNGQSAVSFEVEKGEPSPVTGVAYDTQSHEIVRKTLRDRRHRYEQAEARIRTLEAEVALLKETLTLRDLELDQSKIQTAIQALKRPSWLEQHVGFCAGPAFYYDISNGESGLGVSGVYGFRW
jgi:predicted metalloendopeptidase